MKQQRDPNNSVIPYHGGKEDQKGPYYNNKITTNTTSKQTQEYQENLTYHLIKSLCF